MKLYHLTKKKPVKAIAILVAIIGGVVIITGVLGLLGIINPNSDAFFYTFIIPTFVFLFFAVIQLILEVKEHTRETSKIRDFLLGVVEALDPETIEDLAVKAEAKGKTRLALFLQSFRDDCLEYEIAFYLEKSKKYLEGT